MKHGLGPGRTPGRLLADLFRQRLHVDQPRQQLRFIGKRAERDPDSHVVLRPAPAAGPPSGTSPPPVRMPIVPLLMGKKNTRIGVVLKTPAGRALMPINFRSDVDQVLKDAKTQQKAVLLDFSAAPM